MISTALIVSWLALMIACPVLAIELCRVVRHNRQLCERNSAQAVTICSLQRQIEPPPSIAARIAGWGMPIAHEKNRDMLNPKSHTSPRN